MLFWLFGPSFVVAASIVLIAVLGRIDKLPVEFAMLISHRQRDRF